VIGTVQGGAGQVVHGRVHDNEIFFLATLGEEAFPHHDSRVSHQVPARFEQQMEPQILCFLGNGLAVFDRKRRGLVAVSNAEAAPQVEITEVDAGLPESLDEAFQFPYRIHKRRHLCQLAADVAVDADNIEIGHPRGALVLLHGAFDVDAELCLLKAGGDVWVGLRVHVRIHPDGDSGLFPQTAGDKVDAVQFIFRFHIEHKNTGIQGILDLVVFLAHS